MGWNDHVDWELNALIEHLVDEGLLEITTAGSGIGQQIITSGFDSLSKIHQRTFDRHLAPLLKRRPQALEAQRIVDSALRLKQALSMPIDYIIVLPGILNVGERLLAAIGSAESRLKASRTVLAPRASSCRWRLHERWTLQKPHAVIEYFSPNWLRLLHLPKAVLTDLDLRVLGNPCG